MKKKIKIIIFIFCLLQIAYCDVIFFMAFENDGKKKSFSFEIPIFEDLSFSCEFKKI